MRSKWNILIKCLTCTPSLTREKNVKRVQKKVFQRREQHIMFLRSILANLVKLSRYSHPKPESDDSRKNKVKFSSYKVSQKSCMFHRPGNLTHSGFYKITMFIMLGLCLYMQLHNHECDCGGNEDMFFDDVVVMPIADWLTKSVLSTYSHTHTQNVSEN